MGKKRLIRLTIVEYGFIPKHKCKMDAVNCDKLFVLRMGSAVSSMFSNVFYYIVLGSSILSSKSILKND